MWHHSIKSGRIILLRLVLQRYPCRLPGSACCASQLPGIKGRCCVETRHLSSDSVSLPRESQIVICGGGIVGCSVAYHLAKLGWKDVLLLEQGSLTCGTTWHSVGLLGKLRSTATETRLSNYSVELYGTLEEETGLGTGFKRCGGLLLAQTKDYLTSLKRRAAIGRTVNIESEMLSVKEIDKLWPIGLRNDDIVGGLWVPSEGVATSSDVCQSLARGATLNGVKIFENVCVESVMSDGRRVIGVETNRGKVKSEIFVNCGGQWAWEIGQKSEPKVAFPLHSTEHYYILTKPIEGVPSILPVLRDYKGQIYFREWSGGLMIGGFEMEAIPIFSEGIPKKFEYQLLPENWEHFEELMKKMLHRLPLLQSTEIRHMTNGPESFTSDSRYLLGEVPELCNYYVAAGFNSSGIANAGGAGLALAEWITAGEPTMDLFSVDIRRFAPHHNNKRYLRESVKETLAWHYLLRFPYSEKTRARRVRCSSLYSDLNAAGALWGDKMGWEVAKWFGLPGQDLPRENGFGKPSWLKNVEQEYKACTDGVAVVDLTSLGLLEVESTKDCECESFLQWLCSNDMSIQVGKAVDTLVLNRHGGTELICTVIRDSLNRFIMLLHDSEHVTVAQSLISRNIPKDSAIRLRNIQSAYVILGVLGPNSRPLLQALTQASLDKTAFPAHYMKEIDLGYASGVKAFRTACFGDEEHEWQLLVPSEFAVSVYRDLMEAGRDMGIRNAGRFAVDCLRLERFVPRMGSELTPFTTPWEAGMKHMVNLHKSCDFVGKEALLESRDRLPKKRLVSLTFQQYDDENFPWGGEPILKNGSVVGSITSTCYSFTSGRPISLGFLQDKEQDSNDSFVQEKHFEVDVAGCLFPVTASFL